MKIKLFLKHLAGHIWEPEYDINGQLRHYYCLWCYDIKYPNIESNFLPPTKPDNPDGSNILF